MPTAAVTGAGGYVGSRIAAGLRESGWAVRSLGRSAGADVPFALGDDIRLHGFDALVHCAWDFGARTEAEIERVNVEGSKRLLEAGAGRAVFVSTLSAFPGARSLYGRAKLAVEAHALALGAVVVRPGLVWGPEGGSLYGALRRLARLPLLPVFSGRRLHLAHEDDLAALVARLLDEGADRPVAAAAEESLPLAEILRRIARAEGRSTRTVRVPWRAVWAPLRALEALGLRPPFRSDSVLSLVSLDERPFEHAARPPAPFRPFVP